MCERRESVLYVLDRLRERVSICMYVCVCVCVCARESGFVCVT